MCERLTRHADNVMIHRKIQKEGVTVTTEENQIMQYIEEEDVKFIRLAFCDIFGAQKNISVQPTELQRAFEKGYPIDASYVSGFGGDYGVDVWLHPEADSVSILPWRPEHDKVIRMFCSLCYSVRTPKGLSVPLQVRDAILSFQDG